MTTDLIGLMMIRDEQDMLAEALRNHVRFCHAIFVLDGTQGDGQKTSQAICNAFPQVLGYWQDHETGYQRPLRDGARQFLLERSRERFGRNNWHAVLHGDEIWAEDPCPHLKRVCFNKDAILIRLYHFFPHVSKRNTWAFSAGVSIEALAQWYMMPPIPESRLFWDSGLHNYEVERHSWTIPPGIVRRKMKLVVKQYNYRTPEQAHRRAVERKAENWQHNHYQHLLDGSVNFFVESLAQEGMKWCEKVRPGGGRATNIQRNPLPTWR